MKRNLFENVKVVPYTSGTALHKLGFLSAVIGAVIGTTGDLTFTVTHSDDGTTFEPVSDKCVFPEKKTTGGVYTLQGLTKDDVINLDIDLLGLKDYINVTISGSAAGSTVLAFALGDANEMSV